MLVAARRETATARTLRFAVEGFGPALAGQHVDVRLTAEDGYTAQRSYSLSSAAGARQIELTVEQFPDGEVSPYLVEDLRVGDAVEVRGPVGGWLVWRPGGAEPVQLIAGGSGVAPLMSMLRTRAALAEGPPFRLLYGVTDPDRVYYRDELAGLARRPGIAVDLVHSRRAPEGAQPHRIGRTDLEQRTLPPEARPQVFVCGPTGFVETVADLLAALGHPPATIRTERFGPTGGGALAASASGRRGARQRA